MVVIRASLLLLLVLVIESTGFSEAKKGTFAPFRAGAPDDVPLGPADIDQLNKGVTIKRQFVDAESGEGTALAIQHVHAPVQIILDRIIDFKAYPLMVSGVAECGNYHEYTHPNKTQTLFTKMVLKAAMMKFNGYFHHTYYPTLSSVTWTLDYSKDSDFVDSVGYWYVAKHPQYSDGSHSIVYYSVKLLPASWIPAFVVDILKNQALGQATSWVKYESEKFHASKEAAVREKTEKSTGGSSTMKPLTTPSNSLKCIWWELYSDMLDEKARPISCPQQTGNNRKHSQSDCVMKEVVELGISQSLVGGFISTLIQFEHESNVWLCEQVVGSSESDTVFKVQGFKWTFCVMLLLKCVVHFKKFDEREQKQKKRK
jgi:hypothetical protein